jgi:hypothetical protein
MFWKRKQKIVLHISLVKNIQDDRKQEVLRALEHMRGVTSAFFTPGSTAFDLAVWAQWPKQKIPRILDFIRFMNGINKVETFYFD